MDTNKIINAVQMIHEKILAPVIYMLEDEYRVEFVCFCGAKTEKKSLFEIGEALSKIMSVPVEVVDILEYSPEDGIDIITNGRLVFSEDPLIAQMFEMSVVEDAKKAKKDLLDMINRKAETGTYYLQ